MNERIRELMKQSMVEYQFDLRFSPEKFAELIVRECMSITDKCSTGPGLHDLFADNIIAEHFGVEE